jgi:hypothetical protein
MSCDVDYCLGKWAKSKQQHQHIESRRGISGYLSLSGGSARFFCFRPIALYSDLTPGLSPCSDNIPEVADHAEILASTKAVGAVKSQLISGNVSVVTSY